MLGGGGARAELCFLIHMGERKSAVQGGTKGRGKPSIAGGRDLHTASSPPSGGTFAEGSRKARLKVSVEPGCHVFND